MRQPLRFTQRRLQRLYRQIHFNFDSSLHNREFSSKKWFTYYHTNIPVVNIFVCFQKWMYNPFSPFAPTVEQAGPNPFLSKHPLDLLLEGDVEDVPLITSVTTEDGLVPAGGLCRCCFKMKYILRCF